VAGKEAGGGRPGRAAADDDEVGRHRSRPTHSRNGTCQRISTAAGSIPAR
jgi:hypothetical protein